MSSTHSARGSTPPAAHHRLGPRAQPQPPRAAKPSSAPPPRRAARARGERLGHLDGRAACRCCLVLAKYGLSVSVLRLELTAAGMRCAVHLLVMPRQSGAAAAVSARARRRADAAAERARARAARRAPCERRPDHLRGETATPPLEPRATPPPRAPRGPSRRPRRRRSTPPPPPAGAAAAPLTKQGVRRPAAAAGRAAAGGERRRGRRRRRRGGGGTTRERDARRALLRRARRACCPVHARTLPSALGGATADSRSTDVALGAAPSTNG